MAIVDLSRTRSVHKPPPMITVRDGPVDHHRTRSSVHRSIERADHTHARRSTSARHRRDASRTSIRRNVHMRGSCARAASCCTRTPATALSPCGTTTTATCCTFEDCRCLPDTTIGVVDAVAALSPVAPCRRQFCLLEHWNGHVPWKAARKPNVSCCTHTRTLEIQSSARLFAA